MYVWKALLRQRPSSLILFAENPALAAAVAAPMRKLWVLYHLGLVPIFTRWQCSKARNALAVNGEPFLNRNRGAESRKWALFWYCSIARTRQHLSPLQPIKMRAPFPHWSALTQIWSVCPNSWMSPLDSGVGWRGVAVNY